MKFAYIAKSLDMSSTDDYSRLVGEIFSRHRSVQDAGFASGAYKPGLDRMREFDTLLGGPAGRGRYVHIAGTNGKGSVSHMTAAALAVHGRQVGLYTSPHLKDFRERIKIVSGDGFRMIGEDEVAGFLRCWGEDIDRLGLSFFEITTGMALWWFDREDADVSVVEVGLGGRLDSTNIITPDIAAVTSIGLDHCAILGGTRAEIAAEKAGIFKRGVPAVIGVRDAETAPVFERAAAAVHCPLYWADDNEVDAGLLGRLDLRGEYQAINLRTATTVLELLGEDVRGDGRVRDAIAGCARRTGLRGRWETLCDSPLTIADIGHNPAALRLNFAQLSEMMGTGRYDRLIIVYGVMADKDVDSIIPLMPEGAEYIFTAPATSRAMSAEEILSRFRISRSEDASVGGDVRSSVALARRKATTRSLLYIGGSAFVVAEALDAVTDWD